MLSTKTYFHPASAFILNLFECFLLLNLIQLWKFSMLVQTLQNLFSLIFHILQVSLDVLHPKKAKMQLKLCEIRKIVLWLFFLGTRSKQQCFTIFRNLIKIVDWIGFGIFFILAIATVKESWEAYLNSATSWSIEMHPIQHHPTFYLAFSLSANTIHSIPFHLKLGRDFNITFTANSKR